MDASLIRSRVSQSSSIPGLDCVQPLAIKDSRWVSKNRQVINRGWSASNQRRRRRGAAGAKSVSVEDSNNVRRGRQIAAKVQSGVHVLNDVLTLPQTIDLHRHQLGPARILGVERFVDTPESAVESAESEYLERVRGSAGEAWRREAIVASFTRPLSLGRFLDLLTSVLLWVEEIHNLNYAVNDLKGGNIMIGRRGQLKGIDMDSYAQCRTLYLEEMVLD